MVDLLFIVILVAFFALMVTFVRLCERIVGKEGAVDSGQTVADIPHDAHVDSPGGSSTTPREVPA